MEGHPAGEVLHHVPRVLRDRVHEHPPHGRHRARRDHPAGRDVLAQRCVGAADEGEGLRRCAARSRTASTPRRSAAAVSQFATTLFNAAFFAGLDFGEYQSHSLYIARYPYGREATHRRGPQPGPEDQEHHALRRHHLDELHGDEPHGHAVLDASGCTRRADRSERSGRRATAPVSPPPAPALTWTATPRPTRLPRGLPAGLRGAVLT